MNEWISSTSEALENFAFWFQKKYNKQTNVHASSKQNEDCVTVVCRKVSLFIDKSPSTAECQFYDFKDKQPKLSVNQGKAYFQRTIIHR